MTNGKVKKENDKLFYEVKNDPQQMLYREVQQKDVLQYFKEYKNIIDYIVVVSFYIDIMDLLYY